MEVVAVFSVCFLLNFLGVYTATDAVPETPAANVADTKLKKSRVANSDEREYGSLMEEFMAANQPD